MAVLQTDILIKTAIEGGIADLRRNEWILPDIWGGLATDQLSKAEHGYKEVAAAIEWFKRVNIPVLLDFRVDSPVIPCITVATLPRAELTNRTTLSDDGMIEEVDPKSFNTQPVKVYDSFTPKKFDRATGIMTFPDGITTDQLVAGQFLVASKTGKAYQILECMGTDSFRIAADTREDFKDAYIIAAVSAWNLHRELSFVQETVSISCNTQGNPAENQWLHDLVWYLLFRYKEAYIEARGFELSTMSSDPPMINPNFGETDRVFTRIINLQGQAQIDWIKFVAPKFAGVQGTIVIADGPATPPAYLDGAKNQGWIMEGDVTDEAADDTDDEKC